MVIDLLPNDPQSILMQVWNTPTGVWELVKVDVYSGSARSVERGALDTDTWLTQNGQPVVRYDSNSRGTVRSIHLRAPGAESWRLYHKIRRGERAERNEFSVVGMTSDPGVALVATRKAGDNDTAIYRFDIATAAFGEAVATRPGRQFDDALMRADGRLIGARYLDDRVGYDFAEPSMAAHFRGMNSFLGNECNVRLTDVSQDSDRYLAFASGPREPGAYFFYDRKAKRFDGLGQQRPWLTQDRLAPMEILKVTTRDGTAITAYLTVPLAKGPRPLVVMPHGGPEVRDGYDYDLFAQALAAQGWLVLQPNFRGSDGYGRAFANAGRKHWGDRMQADVEDAVAQVIASGRVETGQVAIFGYSYGGYAALMGAVRQPELYKAVVAGGGVSDLAEVLAYVKAEDGDRSPSHLYWLETIGDPAVDLATMQNASPSLHADRIKAPVLLIHGTADSIVSPKQSRIMANALRVAGKPVELIEIKGAGHHMEDEDWKTLLTKTVDHIAKAFKA
jgi:dipeptidyl aminopeptidase/acylaminoacyl peptidase